jgi:hypothetical protein
MMSEYELQGFALIERIFGERYVKHSLYRTEGAVLLSEAKRLAWRSTDLVARLHAHVRVDPCA